MFDSSFTKSAKRFFSFAALSLVTATAFAQIGVQGWPTYGGNPQHTGISPVSLQGNKRIRWSTPVDLNPQYSGNDLLIHYGSPLITPNNTVIVTVKTGASDGFKYEGRRGTDGTLIWTQATDYSIPAHGWFPPVSGSLLFGNKLAYHGAGGTIYIRDNCDSANGTVTQYCFYGLSAYNANKAAMDAAVQINTPITADSSGNLFFGFTAANNPLNVTSGIARISSTGVGSWSDSATAAGTNAAGAPMLNCAPAISNDGTEVYMAFNGNILAGMSTANLAPLHHVNPLDPKTGNSALFTGDGTPTPMVAPDGDVYYGAFENPFSYTGLRGYMYRFSSALVQRAVCGAFGWDDTASVIPASMVPSYTGSSTYLVFTKYNKYIEGGGGGLNKIAILDPNDTQNDATDGTTVWKEVMTKLGPTVDPRGGWIEWCINTAAVDVAGKQILVNSEDGKSYVWDLTTNTLKNTVKLTDGIGEAYTPTVIGPDGTGYCINNANLFAIGSNELNATTLTVPRGTVGSGGLASLFYLDNNKLVGLGSTQANLSDYPLQYVLTATSFTKAATGTPTITYSVKLSQISGDITQKIEFFNYLTNAYEQVSLRSAGNSLSDTTFTITSNVARFINQTTQEIKARISYKSNKLPASRPLKITMNQANWTINP